MKYLKTYENKESKLKIGDYVIMKNKWIDKPDVTHFLDNNIGQVSNIVENIGANGKYYPFDLNVIYDWVPEELLKYRYFRMVQGGYQMYFNERHIVEYARTKKELKIKIVANKYNI